MHVWRIARAAYDPLDGEGARRAGGRWNSAGLPAVYTAGTQSLAILEALIHLDPELLPRDYMLYRIEIPNDVLITTVEADQLPPDWREPGHAACKTIGDQWLRAGETTVLRVPAAPLHDGDEHGYVINPRLGERIVVKQREPFRFDLRLV